VYISSRVCSSLIVVFNGFSRQGVIMRRLIILLLCCLNSSGTNAYEVKKSQMVPMRDGVHLSTDVYYSGRYEQPRPVVLIRTVYDKKSVFHWNPVWKTLLEKGFAIVTQDIRGRYESEGTFNAAHGRREDGTDTLDWIVRQPFSNGKVGLGGCSYQGEAQVVLEVTNHPALVAGQPQSPASGYYRPGRAWAAFSGGVFELAQTAGWFASNGSTYFYGPPLSGEARSRWFNSPASEKYRQAPELDFADYLKNIATLPTMSILERSQIPPTNFERWRESDPDGDYYRGMDFVREADAVSVPNLFFDTWYDYGARETLMMASQFRKTGHTVAARNHQHLVIGPGTHCNFPEKDEDLRVGERPMANTTRPWQQLQLDWYEYWLAGDKESPPDLPFLTYYLMGADEWRTADAWPIPGTTSQRWYLAGDELQSSKPAEGGQNTFTYDPGNPVPSLGGHTCCTGSDKEAGSYDQREIEARDDVLTFTSAPLEAGLETTGVFMARLYVSSDARDTDFMVKLIDVFPDGTAYNVQEGALRMRYRKSLRQPELIEPGDIYEIDVDLNATSNYFAAGHRIRIEVTSSNFPRFERNLNTGEHNARGTQFIKARNTVFHGGEHASYIELPVVPQ